MFICSSHSLHYNPLAPTNEHIILICISAYPAATCFGLSGCYMFRLVANRRDLTSEYLKPHSNKIILTMLCT